MKTETLLTEKKNYCPVKMEFDYCIQDKELNKKGFSDKLCEHMKKEDAEKICKAVNNYDALLAALKQYENEFQKLFTVPLGKQNEQSLKTWFAFASKDAKDAIKNAEL